MPENSCFTTPFWNQRLNRSKTLLKCARRYFSANFPLISDKLRTETSLLVRSENLGLCFSRLTDDHIYFHLNRDFLATRSNAIILKTKKIFPAIFSAFFKSTENFEHFEKKDELHHLNISEVIDTEGYGFLHARKLVFQNPLLKPIS